MRNDIKIKLSSQYNLLFSDLALRIIVVVFSVTNSSSSPVVIVLIHIITLLIFFYFIKRRKLGIESFLETRSISYSGFSKIGRKISCEIKGDKGIYIFMTIISSAIITTSIIFPFQTDEIADQLDIEFPIYFVSCFVISVLLFRYNHDNFIKANIVAVEVNNEPISHNDFVEYKKFINTDYVTNEEEIFFDNDDWIININRKLNEYRIKAETFLIESVFLGALTFSAFLAIAGPEGYSEITNHDSESLINNFVIAVGKFNFAEIFTYFNEVEKIYFLIACGSIICSVFYIAVLLKRYPIIKNIEILSSGLDKARVWNDREERVIGLEIENAELESDSKKIKLLKDKRNYFSDRIQYELANCEKYRIELETKFKLISIIRLIGLYVFFLVLFISSRIIHQDLCIILLVILLYAIITAKLIDFHYINFSKNNRYRKFNKFFPF
tara:strand:- start:129 stop:1451 length:1323 start_codon:yes stop_codon:yes gene_type:complete